MVKRNLFAQDILCPKSIKSSELQETTLDYQKSLQWSKWDGKTAQRLSLGEIKLSLGQLSALLIAIVTHQTLQSRAIACFQDLLSIWTGWKNWIAKFASDHPAQSGMLWHHKTTENCGMCMDWSAQPLLCCCHYQTPNRAEYWDILHWDNLFCIGDTLTPLINRYEPEAVQRERNGAYWLEAKKLIFGKRSCRLDPLL